jgi:hypothetical protein
MECVVGLLYRWRIETRLSTHCLSGEEIVLLRDVSLKIVLPCIGARAHGAAEYARAVHALVPLEIMLSAKSARAKEKSKAISAFRC